MKRILSLFLAALLLFPLVSCGGAPAPAPETAPGTSPETVPETAPSAPPSPGTGAPETAALPLPEPPVTAPPATEPPATEPPATEPPVTASSETEPPVTQPPETEPPVTAPPVTEPPVTQPPVTQPPVTEAPAPVVLPPDGNLLFDNPSAGIYNYCPTVIEEPDGTRYIYYCTNKKSYNVTDYIGCRKGVPNADGTYTYGEETLVLSPTAGNWDARHTCDPSVIRGVFRYGGETYSYLMAYLGCTSSDNQENKVGLAVARTPAGPFLPVGDKPIVDFTKDPNVTSFQWGVGQPALVSQDEAGKVWLFYTKGDKNGTRTIVRTCDFSDLGAPTLGTEMRVSVKGLKNLNGGTDILNNADFAYAGGTVFYSASDCHPNPSDTPDYIAGSFRVTRLERFTSGGVAFTDANASWTDLATVGPRETGFARNHNVGLVRDEYGRLPDRDYLTVCYTVSVTGTKSLWSYRIYDCNVALR